MTAFNIDEHIGKKLYEFRRAAGYSQRNVGEFIGTTPQQVSKYESGVDKITAGRLYALANFLGVKITRFFDDLDLTQAQILDAARQERL